MTTARNLEGGPATQLAPSAKAKGKCSIPFTEESYGPGRPTQAGQVDPDTCAAQRHRVHTLLLFVVGPLLCGAGGVRCPAAVLSCGLPFVVPICVAPGPLAARAVTCSEQPGSPLPPISGVSKHCSSGGGGVGGEVCTPSPTLSFSSCRSARHEWDPATVEAVAAFRARPGVAEVLPQASPRWSCDAALYRFLKARKMVPADAEAM
jgi:hypothetical protein